MSLFTMLCTETPCFYVETAFARERSGNLQMKGDMTTHHANLCVCVCSTQHSVLLMTLGW